MCCVHGTLDHAAIYNVQSSFCSLALTGADKRACCDASDTSHDISHFYTRNKWMFFQMSTLIPCLLYLSLHIVFVICTVHIHLYLYCTSCTWIYHRSDCVCVFIALFSIRISVFFLGTYDCARMLNDAGVSWHHLVLHCCRFAIETCLKRHSAIASIQKEHNSINWNVNHWRWMAFYIDYPWATAVAVCVCVELLVNVAHRHRCRRRLCHHTQHIHRTLYVSPHEKNRRIHTKMLERCMICCRQPNKIK